MEITYYPTVKVAIFRFYNESQELKEDWSIYEKDFEKWIGISNPTDKDLIDYAKKYMNDYGYKRELKYYKAWFEEYDD